MRNRLLFLILTISLHSLLASNTRNILVQNQSSDKIAETLLSDRQWVPYPNYSNRIGWNNLLGDNKAALIKRGERYLDYQWQYIPATAYLEYERSGDRGIMQNPNNANNTALADLVLAELAEGEGRFLDQIINGVFYHCERSSWVLSAHLPAQLSKRSLPDHTDVVIDLGSGELGSFLAWVYYFFNKEFDKVDPIISQRLYDELYKQIIHPYRNIDRYWWMAFNLKAGDLVNNWNPWTNFNCLQTIALLEDDKQQLAKDVYRSMQSVDHFINYVNSDGACEEGPSYWGHAAGKLYDYLQLIDYMTAGKISYFDHPLIKDMGEYISRSYVGDNWVVNFADASAKFSAPAALIYRYGKAVGSQEMMQFSAFLFKNKQNTISYGIDFFRSLESIFYNDELKSTPAAHQSPELTIYPETQFYYFKNKKGFFFAGKGGHNAESHNHNDIGSFSLWYKNKPLFIDVGVGTYTRQTFGPERYSIWTMRSLYHNLPTINGVEQRNGKDYKSSQLKVDGKNKSLSLNIADAYPVDAAIENWTRSYQLKNNGLVIRDKFKLNKALKANEVNFMIQYEPILTPGKITIKQADEILYMNYDAKQFDVFVESVPLDDIRLSKVWGHEIFRLILRDKKPALHANYQFVITNK